MTAPIRLFGPAAVSTSAAALYTAPANQTIVITRAAVVNVSTAAATLKLWLVPSGGSRANDNIVYGAISAGETVPLGPADPVIIQDLASAVLNPGDALHGISDTATALNMFASGWTA